MSDATDAKKVLIIEDEESLREAIVSVLEDEGYQVLQGRDGEEGLQVALKEHPNLILLDVMMPKLNGAEMLRELRQDAWGVEVPVLVMTAHDDMDKMAQVVELGVKGYLMKTDISLASVSKKVKEYLG